MRRKMAAGNWKMNGLRDDLRQIEAIAAGAAGAGCEVVICPPATILAAAAAVAAGRIGLGGQDCSAHAGGAHTGELSAAMLADAGARHVIIGHSERRRDLGEGDALVAAKIAAAQAAGLGAILCLGESLAEREAGATLGVVLGQLDAGLEGAVDPAGLVVAYEPVWAIGTGRTANGEQIIEVHAALRAGLRARFGAAGEGVRLLYGGSVTAANAAAIFALPDVDGALVGGASLRAESFATIVAALGA
jgi:triosephosphate isomerase